MRQTREILRHKWVLDAIHRRTVEALGASHGSVTQTVQRALRAGLSWGRFVDDKKGVLIVGATGTGKTYLAYALGQQACRQGRRVRYYRTNRLLDELAVAHADGSYPKALAWLARLDLLILDDFLMVPQSESQRRDLFEVLEDRSGNRATLYTSQLPVDTWHAL